MTDPAAEQDGLTLAQREQMVDVLHRHLGFYISEEAEAALTVWVEAQIEERLAPAVALADGWQAEQEDHGRDLASFDGVLTELREALAYSPETTPRP